MRRTICVLGLLAGLLFARGAHATLIDRGSGLIYDDVLDITWAQDADLCVALNNCIPGPGPGGLMTWANAKAWADGLTYQGFSDWRLPAMDVNGDVTIVHCSTNVDCPDNEYGHMFYQNLNGTFGNSELGNQVGDGGVTLNNIQNGYWSGTEGTTFPDDKWAFTFIDGNQFEDVDFSNFHAWAVRDGDVLSVPEPGSLLLLAVGLLGLRLARRWPA